MPSKMDNILKFFTEAAGLKKLFKSGWLLIDIRHPETVSDHTFRVAVMAWLFGRVKKNSRLNMERLLKIALVHDLCERYAGDATPYDKILPQDKKAWPQLFDQWPRWSIPEKVQHYLEKHRKEKESLVKLLAPLPESIKEGMLQLWFEYESNVTPEARLVKQISRAETLLQALEYGKEMRRMPYKSWWLGSEEKIDDPDLVNFMKELEAVFCGKEKITKYPLLAFLVEIGRLKKLARRGWAARGINRKTRRIETVADHSFEVALMVWVLGSLEESNMERALKMALIHEICAVYAGDYTPHDIFRSTIFGRFWPKQERPRLKRDKKQARFLKVYQEETKALRRLIDALPGDLKSEILELWAGFVEKKCKEAVFVDQVNSLATFLQALEYWQQDKNFDIRTFVEGVMEFVHDPQLLELLEAIARRFELDKLQELPPGFSFTKTIGDYLNKAKAVVNRKHGA